MYKKSFYNLEIENFEDSKTLMYNSLSNAIGLMNSSGRVLYENIENLDIDNISIDDKEILKTLLDNGFIVDKSLDEFKLYKTANILGRGKSSSFGLTIATTLDCNMACPYCYEEHKKIYMSKDVADSILRFIEDRFKSIKTEHLDITWYGGEPLLNLDIITYLSEKVIALCEKENIFYGAFVVTNGVLLDELTAKKLKDCKVMGVQITIDGPKDINDKRRLLLDGSSSFDIISNNLSKAKEYLDINVRCNIDKLNVDSVEYLFDYFKELGVNMYVAPVDKLTDVCNAKIDDCFTPYEFKDVEINVLNKKINESKEYLNYIMPSVKSLGCGAVSQNAFVVDPEGNLLKCWNHVGNAEKIVGTVKTGEIFNAVNVEWLSLDIHEKCANCKLLPSCGGGCPDIRINTGKPLCSHRKFTSDEKIKLIYEQYIEFKNNPLNKEHV